jgi:hypothetical protein
VAAINVDSTTNIDGVSVRVFPGIGRPLPVTTAICETDPANGQCLLHPRFSPFVAGEIRTYSVFVHATDAVTLNPGATRIAVEFSTSAPYASTSVAVRTTP